MLLKVNAKEALRSLAASKQRTLLALFGVIIGIGSVMAMLSVGESVKAQALKQFEQMGTDILTVSAGFLKIGSGGKEVVFTVEDLDLLRRYSRYIRQVSPEVEAWGKLRAQKAEISPPVRGVRRAYMDINRLSMQKGRFISPFDRDKSFIVLGSKAARELKAKGATDLMGQITLGGRPFRVIGILDPANLGYRSGDVDRTAFIPLEMAARMSNRQGLSRAVVRLWPDAPHEVASKNIQEIYNQIKGRYAPLNIESPKRLLEQMAKQMRLYTLLLAAVASISLVVGGVGIMNMMLVSVTERRKEIGIRRALGAQKSDITSQFLVESVLLSLVGGALGVVMGILASLVASRLNSWDLVVPTSSVLMCISVALAVGLFFGYYPARKAAGLDVIVALRSD